MSQEWRQLQWEGQKYILKQYSNNNDNDRGNNNSYTGQGNGADMVTRIVMSASLNLLTIVTPTTPLAMETMVDAMAKVWMSCIWGQQ